MTERRVRSTSRVVLLSPKNRALLFLTQAPDSSGFSRWITPGGGVDPGESHVEAAHRELLEETGRPILVVPEPVWTYSFEVSWDQADHTHGYAEYFLAYTEEFEPSSALWTPEEHVDVSSWRWWSAEELEASGEPFEPSFLPELIRRLRAEVFREDRPRESVGRDD